jgi:N6-L-threonylcarbamoyladenine synthase
MALILGIESSCDETAAALLDTSDGLRIRSNIVASQIELHRRYGGVVPELASRAHLQQCLPVIQEALSEANVNPADIDAIAVTAGPGLVGSLLVGVQTAKALSYIWGCDLVGVNHLEGHLEAVFLEEGEKPTFPYMGLLVSGGHTELYLVKGHMEYERLGATRDDAAGEAFDKAAKMMGLSYPGGVAIDRLAKEGDKDAFAFPRAMLHKGLDFSFSGLKTSCRNQLQKFEELPSGQLQQDICASFQEAIVDVLWKKTAKAMKAHGITQVVATGGVAANSRLREVFVQNAEKQGWKAFLPSREFCTDNAAMIASAGFRRLQKGWLSDLSLNANNRMPLAQPTLDTASR